jgi:hypothetical protein
VAELGEAAPVHRAHPHRPEGLSCRELAHGVVVAGTASGQPRAAAAASERTRSNAVHRLDALQQQLWLHSSVGLQRRWR